MLLSIPNGFRGNDVTALLAEWVNDLIWHHFVFGSANQSAFHEYETERHAVSWTALLSAKLIQLRTVSLVATMQYHDYFN